MIGRIQITEALRELDPSFAAVCQGMNTALEAIDAQDTLLQLQRELIAELRTANALLRAQLSARSSA